MAVLDAKALRNDRKGLAFLRAVLGQARAKRPVLDPSRRLPALDKRPSENADRPR